jgi:hypothetical protein
MAKIIRRKPARTGKPRGMMGRPPTGLRPGERLIDYKRITVRLPPGTVSRLEALAGELQITQWRVMVQAVDAFAATRRQQGSAPGAKVGRRNHV